MTQHHHPTAAPRPPLAAIPAKLGTRSGKGAAAPTRKFPPLQAGRGAHHSHARPRPKPRL